MKQLKSVFEQKIKPPTTKDFTLKSLRFRARLTQPSISEITKGTPNYIPQSTLSDWELGKKVPDANGLLTLRRLYQCSREDILIAWENTLLYYQVN